MGKTGRKNKSYSPELKISVIIGMREHNLSYHETVRKYELGNPDVGGPRRMIQRWKRICLEEGAEGLMKITALCIAKTPKINPITIPKIAQIT